MAEGNLEARLISIGEDSRRQRKLDKSLLTYGYSAYFGLISAAVAAHGGVNPLFYALSAIPGAFAAYFAVDASRMRWEARHGNYGHVWSCSE